MDCKGTSEMILPSQIMIQNGTNLDLKTPMMSCKVLEDLAQKVQVQVL
jgi:hypothetical protein